MTERSGGNRSRTILIIINKELGKNGERKKNYEFFTIKNNLKASQNNKLA